MAAALGGKAFLSASFQVLLDRMASSEVVSFIRERKLTDGLLEKLKIAFLSVNAVLEDAEEKQVTNQAAKEWLDELKDAVYDAEDILDEIATKALRRKLDVELQLTTGQVRDLTSASYFSDKVEEEIKEVLHRLEHLEKQKRLLSLREGVGGKPSERLPRTYQIEESDIFGRDDDKEEIVNLLLHDWSNEMSVIGIVGEGGIGKTTLAQLVYNDYRVKEHFDLGAWVCVSEEFDVFKVTKKILEATSCSTCDIKDMDGLGLILKEKLIGKKFLLVLDDVWDETYADWEVLSKPSRYWAKGSRVLITTRNVSFASGIRPSAIHHVNNLPEKYCWSLFANYAFFHGNSDAHVVELEECGRKILKMCAGLPLAIKTIGALLWCKRYIDEWESIRNELWDLSSGIVPINPTLILSYKYLPSHLKKCFAYCSIFPKDYVFEKDQLVLLWMAEGFLQEAENKTMEEVGNDYFLDLLSRSFFQQSISSKSHFVMHDLVNDLARLMSRHSTMILKVDYSGGLFNKTRHLSYPSTRFDRFEKFKVLYGAKRLRTFLPINMLSWGNYLAREVTADLLPKLSCLRVLSFSHYVNVTKLPESFGKLKHLRYLNLSFTTIERLPDSLCKLFNLQTLKLFGCRSLAALPRDLWKLINLRHLDISRTGIKEMPIQLGKLKCLQTLTKYIINKNCASGIGELGKLKNLRGKLSISKLQNVEYPQDALDAGLKDKRYLEELEMQWKASSPNNLECQNIVLGNLQPHTNLKSLIIEGYGAKNIPNWIGHPSYSNIASLYLHKCNYCSRLPPLGQLPSLQDLSIVGFDGIVSVGPEFYSSGYISFKPFGTLKVLSFKHMLNWEEWFSFGPENDGAFPNLRELYVENCPKLTRRLPIYLSSLSKLVVNKCLQLVASIPRAPAICELWLTHCNEALLDQLPTGMQKLVVAGFDALRSLPEGIDTNSSLQELRIGYCSSLMTLSESGSHSALKTLDISFCAKLDLPMYLEYPSLRRLLLMYSCDSLRSIQLELFPNLYEIKICGCQNFESLTIPDQYELDIVALEIDVRDCPNFVSFPKEGLHAPKLTSLSVINCGSLRLLPDKMHILLPSLEKFCIEDCPEVEMFPEGGLPSNLKEISINGCDKLVASRMGWGLQNLPHIK